MECLQVLQAHERRGLRLHREQLIPLRHIDVAGIIMDLDEILVCHRYLPCMPAQKMVKVVMAQVNATVGDLAGNASLIFDAASKACGL